MRGAKHRNITASPRVKPKITLLQLGRILNCIPSFKEPGVRTKPSTLHARARALSLSLTHSLSLGEWGAHSVPCVSSKFAVRTPSAAPSSSFTWSRV